MTEESVSPITFPTDSYSHSTGWIGKTFVSTPSLFDAIGVVRNLAILDVGCGFGRYCKSLLDVGASSYVGIDVSQEMIDLALKSHHGLNAASFLRMDAEEMTFNDQFDLVIANHVLQFCPSVAKLTNVCKNIYRSLRKGRRAVGFVPNGISELSFTEEDGRKFGARLVIPENVTDGQRVAIKFYNGETGEVTGGTTMTWFFKETYEECLKAAGFENVVWYAPTVSKEGIEKFGEDYFRNLLNPPKDIIFEVTK
uniref:Methyltransferase domain-containing protein n=1 Tax=Plectus sambesii TaxID=2011161 RepID=A0A914WLS0_9BILA